MKKKNRFCKNYTYFFLKNIFFFFNLVFLHLNNHTRFWSSSLSSLAVLVISVSNLFKGFFIFVLEATCQNSILDPIFQCLLELLFQWLFYFPVQMVCIILFWIKKIVCVLANKSWVQTFSQAGELFRKIFSFWQISAWLFNFLVVYKKICISMIRFAMFLFRLRRKFKS